MMKRVEYQSRAALRTSCDILTRQGFVTLWTPDGDLLVWRNHKREYELHTVAADGGDTDECVPISADGIEDDEPTQPLSRETIEAARKLSAAFWLDEDGQ